MARYPFNLLDNQQGLQSALDNALGTVDQSNQKTATEIGDAVLKANAVGNLYEYAESPTVARKRATLYSLLKASGNPYVAPLINAVSADLRQAEADEAATFRATMDARRQSVAEAERMRRLEALEESKNQREFIKANLKSFAEIRKFAKSPNVAADIEADLRKGLSLDEAITKAGTKKSKSTTVSYDPNLLAGKTPEEASAIQMPLLEKYGRDENERPPTAEITEESDIFEHPFDIDKAWIPTETKRYEDKETGKFITIQIMKNLITGQSQSVQSQGDAAIYNLGTRPRPNSGTRKVKIPDTGGKNKAK